MPPAIVCCPSVPSSGDCDALFVPSTRWIGNFSRLQQLHTLLPYVPVSNPKLSPSTYEGVLVELLVSPHSLYHRQLPPTLARWPPALYNLGAVIVAAEKRLLQHGSAIQLQLLAGLYVRNRDFIEALDVYLRILVAQHRAHHSNSSAAAGLTDSHGRMANLAQAPAASADVNGDSQGRVTSHADVDGEQLHSPVKSPVNGNIAGKDAAGSETSHKDGINRRAACPSSEDHRRYPAQESNVSFPNESLTSAKWPGPDLFEFIREHRLVRHLLSAAPHHHHRLPSLFLIHPHRAAALLADHIAVAPPETVVRQLLGVDSPAMLGPPEPVAARQLSPRGSATLVDGAVNGAGDGEGSEVVLTGRERRMALHCYLHEVFERMPEVASTFHPMQVELYADFDRRLLLPFLQSSDYYPLQDALNLCMQRGLVEEQVFLLTRMGDYKEALSLLLDRLKDVNRVAALMEQASDIFSPKQLLAGVAPNTYLKELRQHLLAVLAASATEVSLPATSTLLSPYASPQATSGFFPGGDAGTSLLSLYSRKPFRRKTFIGTSAGKGNEGDESDLVGRAGQEEGKQATGEREERERRRKEKEEARAVALAFRQLEMGEVGEYGGMEGRGGLEGRDGRRGGGGERSNGLPGAVGSDSFLPSISQLEEEEEDEDEEGESDGEEEEDEVMWSEQWSSAPLFPASGGLKIATIAVEAGEGYRGDSRTGGNQVDVGHGGMGERGRGGLLRAWSEVFEGERGGIVGSKDGLRRAGSEMPRGKEEGMGEFDAQRGGVVRLEGRQEVQGNKLKRREVKKQELLGGGPPRCCLCLDALHLHQQEIVCFFCTHAYHVPCLEVALKLGGRGNGGETGGAKMEGNNARLTQKPMDSTEKAGTRVTMSKADVGTIFQTIRSGESPPTYFKTNKFTGAFQGIIDAYGDAASAGLVKTGNTYLFGVDPRWKGSRTELPFLNSLKMKMSIVLGVTHMFLGLALSLCNALFFDLPLNIWYEFIPQVLFLASLFGYLSLLIIVKWITASQADLYHVMIYMFLNPTEPLGENELFWGQGTLQHLKKRQGRAYAALNSDNELYEMEALHPGEEGQLHHHHHEEEFDFGEVMVHQMIHTIEFVLGAVSNTASYLRLWALRSGNIIFIIIGFFVFASATVGVLLLMETLSAFLHALRLHWVEFMNKFYTGDGYKFLPFSFDTITDDEE
ncbi:unnamed protein product [Closterium sp. NIES-64]|nr:unnamed protein product [Closterium sp. NIES-64]